MPGSCLASQQDRPEVGWGEGRGLGVPLLLLPPGGKAWWGALTRTPGPGHLSAELGPSAAAEGVGPPRGEGAERLLESKMFLNKRDFGGRP